MDELSDEEALWHKGDKGLIVKEVNGNFVVGYLDYDDYSVGPSSIATNLWHIKYVWSNVINASFKDGKVLEDDMFYSGSVKASIKDIMCLHDEWIKNLQGLTMEDLQSVRLCNWPINNQSFFSLALWVNSEFMKDVAEIGVKRYLYGIEKNSG